MSTKQQDKQTTEQRLAAVRAERKKLAEKYEATLGRAGAGDADAYEELDTLKAKMDELDGQVRTLVGVQQREDLIAQDVKKAQASRERQQELRTAHEQCKAQLALRLAHFDKCIAAIITALSEFEKARQADVAARRALRPLNDRRIWENLDQDMHVLPGIAGLVPHILASTGGTSDCYGLPVDHPEWLARAKAAREKLVREFGKQHDQAMANLSFLLEGVEPQRGAA